MAIQDDALRLAELDRTIVRALLEKDTEGLGQSLGAFFELRKDLQGRLLDESAISVSDKEAANVLRKISGGEGLPSDKIIEGFVKRGGEDISIDEFDLDEINELAETLFHQWYSHYEYVTALAELRPLILCSSASESVTRLVGQVQNCYAFQQYDAAYGLCRTLLEASIRDICERCGLFPELGNGVVLFEKYSFAELRNKVSSGPFQDHLRGLYGRLCEVLHARRTTTKEEAREAFRETLEVVEELYEIHGL